MDITGVQLYEGDTGQCIGLKSGSSLDAVADEIVRRYNLEATSPYPLYDSFDDYMDKLHILLPVTQVLYILSVIADKYELSVDPDRCALYSQGTV